MLFGSIPSWRIIRNTIAVGSLLGLTMCENIDNIDISAGGKATIPKASLLDELLGAVPFSGFDKVDFSETFKNQGVTPDQVDSVHMKAFTIIIEAPNNGNFDFIKSVHFFAQAAGLPKIEIASMDTVPQGKREIDLTINADAELKPYVTAPSMQISSEVQGKRPDQETVLGAAVVLDVDIHIPGCN
jgi:hypothetical protein